MVANPASGNFEPAMSFSSLISGADCATSSNPLSQVLKHTDVDNSLQRDRLGGPGGSSLQHLPRTSSPLVHQADALAARQFFQGQGPNGTQFQPPMMMGMSTPPMLSSRTATLTTQGDNWQEQFRGSPGLLPASASITKGGSPSAWASELQGFSPGQSQQLPNAQQMNPMAQMWNPAMGMGAMQSRVPMPIFQPMTPSFQPLMSESQSLKGKGRAVDADLEEAFRQAEKNSATGAVFDLSDLDETMDRLRLEQDSKQTGDRHLTDFQRLWQDINAPPSNATLEEMAEWEKDFNEAMSAERQDTEQEYDETIKTQFAGLDQEFGLPNEEFKVDGDGMPMMGLYQFEEENSHLKDGNGSLQAAKDLLDAGGSLSEVALMLEAAIQQKDMGEGGYEAWVLLGEVRSMDEREELGMLALREGVRIASEQGGAGGVGMLSLAISYTNEGFDRPSQLLLLNWLKTRYPEHVTAINLPTTFTEPWAIHEVVQDAFLSVARAQQTSADHDPELQVGLGVLLYINGEFTKAADCFGAALSMRSDDYVLWNRYGSCLSNGNKPEESLAAYREALRLRPQYTRAMYNVGVACLNMGAMKEAAEHFLTGLALQGKDGSGSGGEAKRSEQLWATLRRTLIAMDRADLADKARDGNLELFRANGFEF